MGATGLLSGASQADAKTACLAVALSVVMRTSSEGNNPAGMYCVSCYMYMWSCDEITINESRMIPLRIGRCEMQMAREAEP